MSIGRPKGNHEDDNHHIDMRNVSLIENDAVVDDEGSIQDEEMKIDELYVKSSSDVNVRKAGIISEKIRNEEMEEFEIKVYQKDRT